MEVNQLNSSECATFLQQASLGRLACSHDDQPYVVPIHFAYDGTYVYGFSTLGQKIEWMRDNPKVCIQADEIEAPSKWTSVIVFGEYEELPEPQYTAERKHASSLLSRHCLWWLNALGHRQMSVGELSIEPLFFRIRIQSMSGLQAI